MHNLAVCAIMKDEAENLLEWIAYYRVLGVDKFFLYDNESTDETAAVLAPLVRDGVVERIDWPFRPGQIQAYDDFAERFGSLFEWAAFIDLDEYINLFSGHSLVDFLSRFESASAVALQWLNFGPCGHIERPEALTTESYTLRFPDDFYPAHGHVKSIVRMSDYKKAIDPHSFSVTGTVVDENGKPVQAVNGIYSIQKIIAHREICINHYYTRSKADWLRKIGRGMADYAREVPSNRDAAWFNLAQEKCTVSDLRIQRLLPALHIELARLAKRT